MSQKHTKKTLPLGDRVIGTIWWIIILVWIGILWLYLYGSYFTILWEPAPITPLYAEWWIYASIWIFSFVGIIMTILLIMMMIRKYRWNALQLTIRSVLCQIWLYLLFLIVTPGYTIQLVPQIFWFTDLKAEYVTNTKMYFFWVDTLGYDFVKWYKFQTLDDAIEGLEFAKSNIVSSRDLYENTFFYIWDTYGYKDVFIKYNDTFFQKIFLLKIIGDFYVINYYLLEDNIYSLNEYILFITDEKIKNAYYIFYEEYINLIKKKLSNDQENIEFQKIENKVKNLILPL